MGGEKEVSLLGAFVSFRSRVFAGLGWVGGGSGWSWVEMGW